MPAKLATLRNCTGCMLCLDVCKHNAIFFTFKEGFYYPNLNKELCINCKLCEKHCPVLSHNNTYTNKYHISTPFAAWSKIDNHRKDSASGGAFYEIASKFLDDNKNECKEAYVCGAAIVNNSIKHIFVSTQKELHNLQGAKYFQSNTKDSYKTTLKLLEEGCNILYSGLPCQINALKNFLHNKKYKGTLITCDLICNGVASSQLLNIDITHNLKNFSKLISFRDKKDGFEHPLAITYKAVNNDIIRIPFQKSFLLKAIRTNYFLRRSCYNCSFCHIERASDFTLGDFWGNQYSDIEKNNGISLIICHNEKAINILKSNPNLYYKITSWKECLPYNPRIYCGKRVIGNSIPRFIRKRIDFISYNVLSKMLTNETGIFTNKNILWIPYKIWTLLLKKIEDIYRTFVLKQILRKYEEK